MPDPAIASAVAQFGAAGLIAAMWLLERRAAAQRDNQLAEAHRRIQEDRVALDALLAALDRATRALTALESGQQRLAAAIERMTLARRRGSARAAAPQQRRRTPAA
jgi:small-conductance mechanosensitive channel